MMLAAGVYVFGGLAALATFAMIFQRNPVKAAMLMLAALLSTAGLYLVLSAQLLAVLQVILYAGAIMTLFIVAITVTPAAWRDTARVSQAARSGKGIFAKILGLAAAAVILTELLSVSASLKTVIFSREFSETGTLELARALFGRFAFQFELLSLVILASIVAAVALASKRRTAQ
jgi:NADH-quinone oxidoreductase subunit J